MAAPRTQVPRGRRSWSRRRRRYPLGEAAELLPKLSTAKFDATVEAHLRLGVDPRHADQLVRGTVVLPHGTGRSTAGHRLRPGREGAGGAARRRRRGRRRGPGQAHRRRLVRVRRGHRHARHDGHGRPPREEARAARPDAEPQVGHRDLRHRAGGERDQVRPHRVQGRSRRHRARAGWPGELHARSAARQRGDPGRRHQPRQANRRQGHLHAHPDPGADHGPGRPDRHSIGAGRCQRLVICRRAPPAATIGRPN